jgi:hypothetical protein
MRHSRCHTYKGGYLVSANQMEQMHHEEMFLAKRRHEEVFLAWGSEMPFVRGLHMLLVRGFHVEMLLAQGAGKILAFPVDCGVGRNAIVHSGHPGSGE